MDTRLLSAILAGVAVFFGLLALFPGAAEGPETSLRDAIRAAVERRRARRGRAAVAGSPRPVAAHVPRPPGRGAGRARARRLARLAAARRGRPGGRPPAAPGLPPLPRLGRSAGRRRGRTAGPPRDGQPRRGRRHVPRPLRGRDRGRPPPLGAGRLRGAPGALLRAASRRSRPCSRSGAARRAGTSASCSTRSSFSPPRTSRRRPRPRS